MDALQSHDPSSESCPYCHSTAKLYFSTHMRHYFHCDNCDLIFRGNRGSEDRESLIRYYENQYFFEHAHDQLDGARNILYSRILDRIEEKTKIGRLLDVGCGCGFFLKEAENRGWDVAGVDPSRESISYCKNILNGGVACKGTLKNMSQEKMYDVITMINVLDHSAEPWSEIAQARVLIKPEGLLFIRFPNGIVHSALYIISKSLKIENFIKDFLVFHEYSFTPIFIRRMLRDQGFSNIVIQNAGFSGGTFLNRLLKKSFGLAVNILFEFSAGRLAMGTSLELTAHKT